MSMFIRFWSTLGNVFFTLYCLYNIRTRIARAAPLFPRSTFGGSKRSILQFPNGGYRLMMRFFLRRWICSFWVVDFVFSDVFSPTLSMWHTQCSAGIIFTWFSLKFNDSYVLLVFKLLPHCKRVFCRRVSERNWTSDWLPRKHWSPPDDVIVYFLFSLMKACGVGTRLLCRAKTVYNLLENEL